MPVEINEIIITTTVTNNVAGSAAVSATGQTATDKKLKKALEELKKQIKTKNER
ncbi:MAG TPA: DUF5908 family protein [Pedobacter sp.]|jgi:hypothetical protein|uniref:DUF5908 family protein n=1 Tax=Pedobacter sp. TaxID=1411316 RepID=UPI002CB11E7F|nr:DUF5908 family protein [Pedobacter sp.]HMI05889.1 DUF5908 family protein [Pedobacter sp.]